MSHEDREKWDQRYASGDYRKSNPVALLHEWAPGLPVGRALDVACGAGRNALYLARLGFDVDAVDISSQGLQLGRQVAAEEQLSVNWIEHDFDEDLAIAGSYDLIIVFWFVNLPLISRLCQHLKPGGYLLSAQHLAADGDLSGPRSSRFRVPPGSLRAAVKDLEVLFYEEGSHADDEGGSMASAAVVARKPG